MPDLRTSTRAIFEQALQSCSIQRALDRKLPITTDANGSRLVLSGRDPDGHDIVPLDGLGRVRIVSAGKAGAAMLDSLLSRLSLPPSCDLRGVLIAPERPLNLPPAFQFFPGGHPVPNAASFAGASAALCMLRDVGLSSPQDALCIFLISGGASAMMELPLDPSISLDDAIAFHRALVHSGASIVEINCVRKHFSAVKGGRLALAAGSAHKFSLLVSDAPPAHLDALASGPASPTPAPSPSAARSSSVFPSWNSSRRPCVIFSYLQTCPRHPSPAISSHLAASCWKRRPRRGRAQSRRQPWLPRRHRQHLRRLELQCRSRLLAQSPAPAPPRAS